MNLETIEEHGLAFAHKEQMLNHLFPSFSKLALLYRKKKSYS